MHFPQPLHEGEKGGREWEGAKFEKERKERKEQRTQKFLNDVSGRNFSRFAPDERKYVGPVTAVSSVGVRIRMYPWPTFLKGSNFKQRWRIPRQTTYVLIIRYPLHLTLTPTTKCRTLHLTYSGTVLFKHYFGSSLRFTIAASDSMLPYSKV